MWYKIQNTRSELQIVARWTHPEVFAWLPSLHRMISRCCVTLALLFHVADTVSTQPAIINSHVGTPSCHSVRPSLYHCLAVTSNRVTNCYATRWIADGYGQMDTSGLNTPRYPFAICCSLGYLLLFFFIFITILNDWLIRMIFIHSNNQRMKKKLQSKCMEFYSKVKEIMFWRL